MTAPQSNQNNPGNGRFVTTTAATKAKVVPADPQDSSIPAALVPSCPSTGQGRYARTRVPRTAIKPVAHDSSGEEFELPDVASDSDGPQDEPAPDHSKGLLTPQSNTLATLDSDTGPPVSDMEVFFDEFCNEDGVKMRRCNACLKEGLSEEKARCYGPNTGNSNLRKHLVVKHLALYKDAAKTHNWKHKSLDAQDKPAVQEGSPGHGLPDYTYAVFIQFLIRFIVVDDQASIALLDFCLTLPF
ncbi:hypothetical protein EDB89DRAFT_1916285 [Lactarius sanguifluus]|nr:hypothetical protein EDB89DRAFT_1916285 [Lactarius sanguifluus]